MKMTSSGQTLGATIEGLDLAKPLSQEEFDTVLTKPQTQERMKTLGAVTVADAPAEFAAFLKIDHERWARVIKASGVKAE
jgi:tripartite-type tricarboxylate transporter receptor subunit TctC